MDTQTQIERLIELAIVQRGELRKLVGELPQLREHLNAEIERVFEETEPQLRVELEEFVAKQAQERTDAISAELKAKIDSFAKTLNQSAEAKYSALVAERAKNDDLLKQAEQNIAFAAQALPAQVKEIVTAELARFPRAGEIDQLRKEFAEPKGLNPRGKWSPDATYNKLDLVGYNGDSFVSNIDGNRERPSRTSESWTLNAARGTGGGGGLLSINDALGNPTSDFTIVGAEGNNYVQKTLVAGANITITESPTAITIIGDEGQISLQDGTAAAPSLFFTNDTDTGLYRPAANTLGISVSGTQIAYFDQNGLTIPNAGVVAGGSIHAANGNANNPSHSFSGDQDTGFFRHQPNEIGIALGGTQYATLTSTTFSITPSVTVGGTFRASGGIVGTAIGASSPSTGAFTTLSASTSLTSPDLTLGTSGPSAKSSIAARAARQGLVFDGTAGATVSIASLGTAFTIHLVARPNVAGSNLGIFRGSGGSIAGNSYFLSDGRAAIYNGSFYVASTSTITANKTDTWTYVLSGGTGTWYKNGVVDSTTSDAGTYPNALDRFGVEANGYVYQGAMSGLIYNRALSAAEVVSLYESGVPSGADYNSASNTSKLTGANSDFSSAGNWTVTGSTTISGGKLNLSNGDQAYCTPGNISVPVGGKFRVTLTVDSITAGSVQVYTGGIGGWVNIATTAGTFTQEFTFSAASGPTPNLNVKSTGGNAVVDTVLYYQIGLLLAPDAAQAGGGLTWYDTSGNAANITLPASGVSWNVPSSLKTASGWTFGGTVLAGTAAAQGILASKNGSRFISLFSTSGGNGAVLFDSTSALRFGTSTDETGSGFSELARLTASGNYLLGATTDGGQKLQVAGNVQITNTGANGLVVTNTQGNALAVFNNSAADASGVNNGYFTIQTASSPRWYFGQSVSALSGDFQIYSVALGASVLSLAKSTGDATFAGTVTSSKAGAAFVVSGNSSWIQGPSGGALALLGTSGNDVVIKPNGGALAATFSSTVATLSVPLRLGNAYTAGAPTATGYVTIQDSAGNTYKVLVGT